MLNIFTVYETLMMFAINTAFTNDLTFVSL